MKKSGKRTSPKQIFGFLSIFLVGILGVVAYKYTKFHPYWILLITAGFITFLLYGFDKVQSKRKGLRVPEITLHILALAGGFIGGLIGRLLFRHKTRKGIFTFILAISAIAHLGIIYFLFLR